MRLNIHSDEKNRNNRLSLLCLITSFMLAFIYSFISLDLSQKDIAFNYLGLIVVFIAVCSITTFLWSVFKNKRLYISELFSLLFIVYIIINVTLVSISHTLINISAKDTFIEMMVKTVPSILLAIVAARKHIHRALVHVLDFFVVIMSIGYIKPCVGMLFGGVTRTTLFDTYGVDYQTISYYAAYWFCLDMFMIIVGRKYTDMRFGKSVGFQICRLICAALLFITSLSSGGRGGFVLILADIFFWLILYMIQKKKYKQLIVSIIIIIVGLILVSKMIAQSHSLFLGFDRVFEFIGPSGLDWGGTSGRDIIYKKDLELISQSPIWGYGITGGNYYGIKSCHNWFLEMLVEGGIIYLFFWICILFSFGKKILRGIQKDERYLIIFTIFMTDFIGLMFSFVSWRCTAIWFSVFYVLNDREVLKWKKR